MVKVTKFRLAPSPMLILMELATFRVSPSML